MKLENYRLFFIAAGIIGLLLVASPTLPELIQAPASEQFSELYLLDSNHTTDNYPYNIALRQNYSVYIGVGNHLNVPAYYVLYLKLLNRSDQLPNTQNGTSSPAKVLYEYNLAINENQTWENLLTFSISQGSVNNSQAMINNLIINDTVIEVDKTALWDSSLLSYPYKMILELWIYNTQQDIIQYNNRYVYLNFNFSSTA